MVKGARTFEKTQSELVNIKRKYDRILSSSPGTVLESSRRRPSTHHIKEIVDYVVTILFGNVRYDCIYDDVLMVFDGVMRAKDFSPFKVSDSMHAVRALHDFYQQMGTGSGSGAQREKLKTVQTVTSSLMRLTPNGGLINRTLFTGRGPNILPQTHKTTRNPFVEESRRRRLHFNRNPDSRTLSKSYFNETREPRMFSL